MHGFALQQLRGLGVNHLLRVHISPLPYRTWTLNAVAINPFAVLLNPFVEHICFEGYHGNRAILPLVVHLQSHLTSTFAYF